MLRRSCTALKWIGGKGVVTPVIGTGKYNENFERVNTVESVVEEVITKEALSGLAKEYVFDKFHFEPRADIYNELLKLPLRFKLHPFEKIEEAASKSAVGYFPPLGPAEPLDTIPFHAHRGMHGTLPSTLVPLMNKFARLPFYLRIDRVDGDLFRFEEELIKIFPYHRTHVRPYCVILWDVNYDGVMVLHHWLYGLGF
jgi:hypothetical protein